MVSNSLASQMPKGWSQDDWRSKHVLYCHVVVIIIITTIIIIHHHSSSTPKVWWSSCMYIINAVIHVTQWLVSRAFPLSKRHVHLPSCIPFQLRLTSTGHCIVGTLPKITQTHGQARLPCILFLILVIICLPIDSKKLMAQVYYRTHRDSLREITVTSISCWFNPQWYRHILPIHIASNGFHQITSAIWLVKSPLNGG